MNIPYSEPSKTEHPSRTAYFERLMAEVEPVQAPQEAETKPQPTNLWPISQTDQTEQS